VAVELPEFSWDGAFVSHLAESFDRVLGRLGWNAMMGESHSWTIDS